MHNKIYLFKILFLWTGLLFSTNPQNSYEHFLKNGSMVNLLKIKKPVNLSEDIDLGLKSFSYAFKDTSDEDLILNFGEKKDVIEFYGNVFLRDDIKPFLENKSIWIRAFIKDKLVAWMSFEPELKEPNVSYISTLVVDPDYQRLGIGKILLQSVKYWWPNTKEITLFVRKINKNAINFYNNFGFREDLSISYEYKNSIYMRYTLSKEFKFLPVVTDILTENFFYNIYPGKSKARNQDNTKEIITLGISGFYIINEKQMVKKYYTTNHQQIRHGFFSLDEKYIITTSSDNKVDIWDSEFKLISTIVDDIDGIHIGIFGRNDGEIITNSKNDNNYSKVWMLPPDELLNPKTLLLLTYTKIIKEFMEQNIKNEANYESFIKFITDKYHLDHDIRPLENTIFNKLDNDTQAYLSFLIPGRE